MIKERTQSDLASGDNMPSVPVETLPPMKRRDLLIWEQFVRDELARIQTDRLYTLSYPDKITAIGCYLADIIQTETPVAVAASCPLCGGPLEDSGQSGYLTHLYAYLRHRCCNQDIFTIFCFRRPIQHPAALVLPGAGYIYIMPGASWEDEGNDWTLWQAMLELQSRQVVGGFVQETGGGQRKNTNVVGRGTSNPGHLIFQDIVAAWEHFNSDDELDSASDLICTSEASWIAPLVRAIFHDRVVSEVSKPFLTIARADTCHMAIPRIRVYWPNGRNEIPALQSVIKGFASLAHRHEPVFGNSPVIVVHMRFGPREWLDPIAKTSAFIEEVRQSVDLRAQDDLKFVLHIVGDPNLPALAQLHDILGESDDVAFLINPTIGELAANMYKAVLAVGVIGTAFWWPALADVPCVTLHPTGNSSTVVIYEWIALPEHGELPLYLKILTPGRWIGLEEERETPRKPFDPVDVPVDKVVAASIRLLKETLSK